MKPVPVVNHRRRWPVQRRDRYYIGIVGERVRCFIKAKTMNDAWNKFAERYAPRTTAILDLRPMTCKELAKHLTFDKQGFRRVSDV